MTFTVRTDLTGKLSKHIYAPDQLRIVSPCNRLLISCIFILLAFITGNSSLEPMFWGLLAQIHTDVSSVIFGLNQTGDLRITHISITCRALIHCAKMTKQLLKIHQNVYLDIYI